MIIYIKEWQILQVHSLITVINNTHARPGEKSPEGALRELATAASFSQLYELLESPQRNNVTYTYGMKASSMALTSQNNYEEL